MQTSPNHSLLKRSALPMLAAALLLAAAPTTALAQIYWSEGHGDIGIELHGDHFHTHWHLESQGEFGPSQVIAWTTSMLPAPEGALTWLGVAEGAPVFAAGSPTYQPNLGFAAEGIGLQSDWQGNGLTLSLSGWSNANPGNFALFAATRDGFNILMSTFDGGQTLEDNSLHLLADSHRHYTFLFSEAGYYELTFTWSGYHLGLGREISITDTYGFHAGAIPEPSTWALLLGSVTGLGVIILRRRKNG